MNELVDRLAELTGFRDRGTLDLTLVDALRDMLVPSAVAAVSIYRSVGEPGDERWACAARLAGDDRIASSDSAFVDPARLPPLDAHPARLEAFTRRRPIVAAPGGAAPHLSVFPLQTEDDAVGVVEVESRAPLDAAARAMVAGVLRIFGNVQGLLDYSERDTLTGLLNRKTFGDSFLKATAETGGASTDDCRGRRAGGRVDVPWLGLIDIDHFKRVNDDFGHVIGDEVLLLLARLMRGSFRASDRLYRFGGEEFLVLMRCGSAPHAALALDRLRRLTEAYAFPQVGRITISIGHAEVRAGDTPENAIERADRAVYYAKAHGRNQVCGYAELLARGELVEAEKASDVELF